MKRTPAKKAPAKKAPAKRKTRAKRSGASPAVVKQYVAGATLDELKAKYGIRGKSQLATAVLDSLIKEGKMPPLARRGRKPSAKPKDFKVKVNKRGTVVLPKEAVVEAFGAKTGQTYSVKKRGKKIILTETGA